MMGSRSKMNGHSTENEKFKCRSQEAKWFLGQEEFFTRNK